MSDGTQFNTKRLLKDVHTLVKMLRARTAVGQSRVVVVAPRDDGEHQRTQRQLKTVLQMLQPVAASKDVWVEPVGDILIPNRKGESTQRQAASAQDLSPQMRRQIRADIRALENGDPVRGVEMLGPTTSASSSSDSGDLEYQRTALSLADASSWQCAVPHEKDQPGRAMGTTTKTVEAYLPMAFMQDALEQIWRILNELNLGVPQPDTRPENEMEWEIEDFEEPQEE